MHRPELCARRGHPFSAEVATEENCALVGFDESPGMSCMRKYIIYIVGHLVTLVVPWGVDAAGKTQVFWSV